MEEIRERMVRSRADWTGLQHPNFREGFNCAMAVLEPEIRALVKALEAYESFEKDSGYDLTVASQALDAWRKFENGEVSK